MLSFEDKVRLFKLPFETTPQSTCLIRTVQDLQDSLLILSKGNALAASHRSAISLTARMSEMVHGSRGVGVIKKMNAVELHAELLYAETLFAKVGFYGCVPLQRLVLLTRCSRL